jgi:hypothetical protein
LLTEASRVLALAPRHPMVQLWQAYIYDKKGQRTESDKALEAAIVVSADLVFPFRPETLDVLQWANQRKGHWKLNYYEGLISWQNNQAEVAQALFKSCGTTPDFAPFYLAKAELFKLEPDEVRTALEKAYQLDPRSWRPASRLATFYASEKQPDKALSLTEKSYKIHSTSYIVGLQYAQMLVLNKQYVKALNELNKLVMLPAELDFDAPILFKQANVLCALENMKNEKWKIAIQYLLKAETWPENLGTGQPYNPDNRVTQFFLAYCYEQSNNKALSNKALKYVESYQNRDEDDLDPAGNKLTELVKQHNLNYKTITETVLKDVDKNVDYFTEFLTVLKN